MKISRSVVGIGRLGVIGYQIFGMFSLKYIKMTQRFLPNSSKCKDLIWALNAIFLN